MFRRTELLVNDFRPTEMLRLASANTQSYKAVSAALFALSNPESIELGEARYSRPPVARATRWPDGLALSGYRKPPEPQQRAPEAHVLGW